MASNMTSTAQVSSKQKRFSLLRMFKSKKRSNRTASTSFCDDESFLLCDFEDDDDDILIDLTKKKGKRKSKRTSSSSLSSRRSGSWRSRHKSETDAVSALLDMGDAELEAKHEDRATKCWKQAARLSRNDASCLHLHDLALWKLARLNLLSNRSESLGYLVQINLDKIPREWLSDVATHKEEASVLLDLLCEQCQWSTALRLAELMEDTDARTLTRIRFQVAQQSGSIELLEAFCSNSSTEYHRQALYQLAKAHAKRGEWDQALFTNDKLMETSNPVEKAEAYSQKAELQFLQGHTDLAWESLQEGFEYSLDPQARLLLLQTKAQLLYKTGSFVESLQVHHDLVGQWRSSKGPICPEVAKCYYTMGRICLKANMPQKAVECFRQELHITQVALGKNHLEVSRILHDIARLYDEHLGDYERSLKYYQRALQVEQACVKHENSFAQRELLLQIRETQKCMGRIHYKMGDFGMAVQTSFDGAAQVANL